MQMTDSDFRLNDWRVAAAAWRCCTQVYCITPCLHPN